MIRTEKIEIQKEGAQRNNSSQHLSAEKSKVFERLVEDSRERVRKQNQKEREQKEKREEEERQALKERNEKRSTYLFISIKYFSCRREL